MKQQSRAAVVYHPGRVRLAALRRAVGSAERSAKWAPSLWLPTNGDGPSHEAVAAAIDAGVDLVIAAGGDGTISGVASALRGGTVPMGVLPVGTANLLARNLGIPQIDLAAAARVAFTGAERRLDLGTIDFRLADGSPGSRYFTVMGGFGVAADMVTGAAPEAKQRFGWLAYVAPILRSVSRAHGDPVTYTIGDAASVTGSLHTMFVGSCGTVTAGLRLLPGAVVDDGLLDVLTISSLTARNRQRLVRWLTAHAARKFRGRAVRKGAGLRGDAAANAPFRYLQTREVELELGEGLPLQADGDEIGTVVWARFGIDPAAVTVRVPRRGRPPS